uniref:MAM domain-containing protein n=1 Tax=Tetranychus urticae TaxID=32264 RepID=T1K4M3_TETUR
MISAFGAARQVHLQPNGFTLQVNLFLALPTAVNSKSSYLRLTGEPLKSQITTKCTLTLRYIGYGLGWANLIIGFVRVNQSSSLLSSSGEYDGDFDDNPMEPLMVIPTSISTDWHQITVPLIVTDPFYPIIQINKVTNNWINKSSMVNKPNKVDSFDGQPFVAIDDTILSEPCFQSNDQNDARVNIENHHDLNEQDQDAVYERIATSLQNKKVDNSNEKFFEKLTLELNETQILSTFKSKIFHLINDNQDELDNDNFIGNQRIWNEDLNWCEPTIIKCQVCLKAIQDNLMIDQIRCPKVCNLDTIETQGQFIDHCGWTQSRLSSSVASWILVTSDEASRYISNYPLVDASPYKGSILTKGKYLLLKLDNKVNPLPSISLISPVYISTRETCYFTFSYLINDSSAVYYLKLTFSSAFKSFQDENNAGTDHLIIWKSDDSMFSRKNQNWSNGSAYIGKHDKPFTLSFVRASIQYYSKHGIVALDNLNFIAC